MDQSLGRLDFVAAAEAIRAVVSRANRYVEENAPWKLAKTDRDRLATVMYTLVEIERLVAAVLAPFMPGTAVRMLEQLGSPGLVARSWGVLPPGTVVSAQPTPLFPRIEVGVAVAH